MCTNIDVTNLQVKNCLQLHLYTQNLKAIYCQLSIFFCEWYQIFWRCTTHSSMMRIFLIVIFFYLVSCSCTCFSQPVHHMKNIPHVSHCNYLPAIFFFFFFVKLQVSDNECLQLDIIWSITFFINRKEIDNIIQEERTITVNIGITIEESIMIIIQGYSIGLLLIFILIMTGKILMHIFN